VVGIRARELGPQRGDRQRKLGRVAARDLLGAQIVGLRRVADHERLVAARGRGAARGEGRERLGGDLGHLAVGGEQERRRDRVGEQDGGGERACPVAGVGEDDGGRGVGGERRERGAGRDLDRVPARDARRVAGRERREAELRGLLRLGPGAHEDLGGEARRLLLVVFEQLAGGDVDARDERARDEDAAHDAQEPERVAARVVGEVLEEVPDPPQHAGNVSRVRGACLPPPAPRPV